MVDGAVVKPDLNAEQDPLEVKKIEQQLFEAILRGAQSIKDREGDITDQQIHKLCKKLPKRFPFVRSNLR